ncbi:MAG: zf-HC2 domain-containing protein [Planctomycetota bacterium]|nr:zf-HC2 domain-containing protein [Planctomycetota bacterium]
MCPNETKILRLLTGELPDAERDLVLAHLAECNACRNLHRSLQATWDQLGQWEPTLPSRDLTGAILAAASRESIHRRWYARSGIAAAILVAAGIGWTLGRQPFHPSRPMPSGTVVSTEEMAQKVGLDALGGDLGAFDFVFSMDATPDSPVQGG